MADLATPRYRWTTWSRPAALLLLLAGLLSFSACRSEADDATTETPNRPSLPVTPEPSPQQMDARPTPDSTAALPPSSALEEQRPSLIRDAGATGVGDERLAQLRASMTLEIDHLVSQGEVRQISGYLGPLHLAPLEGQPVGREYNAFRLATEDSYGFGLQVWRLRSANLASSHFNRMRETYVVTGSTRVDGETAFWAALAGIQQLVLLSSRRNHVVVLSCDEAVCTDPAVLVELAERVSSRL